MWDLMGEPSRASRVSWCSTVLRVYVSVVGGGILECPNGLRVKVTMRRVSRYPSQEGIFFRGGVDVLCLGAWTLKVELTGRSYP